MNKTRSKEPFWWLLFSGGMMLDALAMPALIVITGLLVALGLVSGNVRGLFLNPLVRIGLFVLISLTFFHAAHRLHFTLADFGLRSARGALAFICYGAAIAGTLVAGAVALGLI
jgi:fumarate reductase subunit D